MTCYDLIFEQAFPFLLEEAVSAWMIFKKQASQLFTLLSCNSAQLFEKKIWKPVLMFFREFNSAFYKFQDARRLEFTSLTAGDNWSST